MTIDYRKAILSDALKLSILFKQVYIATYGVEGVSDEFANFITRRFAVEKLERMIKYQPERLVVAVYKNNLVGAVEMEFDKASPVGGIVAPELNKLYILEWFCAKGIGERLLAEAEKIVISKGYTQMWLWVLQTNARAIAFYSKHGYRIIGNASFQMQTNTYDNEVMLKTLT
jgi:ribosomal protein S18 acetylase RimI-like enzyme